jgi:hypothetical protein
MVYLDRVEHRENTPAEASTDEQVFCPTRGGEQEAFGSSLASGEPAFASEAEARAYWDGVTHGLRCATGENRRDDDEPPHPRTDREAAAEILDPSGRRLRQDGWLPAKKARFLLILAAGGVVADACRAVGMSVASAYALRNRRSGRAFAMMWDAILIHRARSRLADNNLSRAMNGCVDQIVKDGIVVAERRRFDNRLSMAMLTRLDRLAESKTGDETELSRALSEDFEDYLEVVETGGDEDAFVEARRPLPEDEGEEEEGPDYEPDQLDELAAISGCHDWRDVDFIDVPVDGLDPDRKSEWSPEDWVRAGRSFYLIWLDMMADGGKPLPPGVDCPAAYDRVRREITEAMKAKAAESEADLGETPWQASTSSTSPAGPPPPRPSDPADGGEM